MDLLLFFYLLLGVDILNFVATRQYFVKGGFFMNSVRSKKKLSFKVLNRLFLVISAICFENSLIIWIVSKHAGETEIYYWFLNCAIGSILIYFVGCFVLFRVRKRKNEEQTKETNDLIHKNLSWREYKEVNYKKPDGDRFSYIMWCVIQMLKLKFYVKLDTSQNIFLVIRNKDDKWIDSFAIDDYNLFITHFDFLE